MVYLLRNANVYIDGGFRKTDIYIKEKRITSSVLFLKVKYKIKGTIIPIYINIR